MISEECRLISPVQIAAESVAEKTAELTAELRRYRSGPQASLQPLLMLLKGILDPSVNGGIPRFQSAFLGEHWPLLQGAPKVLQQPFRRHLQLSMGRELS